MEFLILQSAQAPQRKAMKPELQVKREYLKSVVLKEGIVFSVATGTGGDVAIGDSPAGDPATPNGQVHGRATPTAICVKIWSMNSSPGPDRPFFS